MYYVLTGDYQQCVKEYSDLIARYAADVVGAQPAGAVFDELRDMRTALDAMRRVVQMVPNRVFYRGNLALLANYAGDFQTAEQEARKIEVPDIRGTAGPGLCPTGTGSGAASHRDVRKLATINALGASFAVSGLGDLAVYEGRFRMPPGFSSRARRRT